MSASKYSVNIRRAIPTVAYTSHSLDNMAAAAATTGTLTAQPSHPVLQSGPETEAIAHIIAKLGMQRHPEGGYFVETDRDSRRVPNPFLPPSSVPSPPSTASSPTGPTSTPTVSGSRADDTTHTTHATRAASTTIFYLLTPLSPRGVFHRNKARTVHTLHWGRGRYVVVHPAHSLPTGSHPTGSLHTNSHLADSPPTRPPGRIETFDVGHDISKGERLQWVVEGGRWKASYLYADKEEGEGEGEGVIEKGLLISETVVPGFEFEDHDFLTPEAFEEVVAEEDKDALRWLVRDDHRQGE